MSTHVPTVLPPRHGAPEQEEEPMQLALRAKSAPLLMFPWLLVSLLLGVKLADVFGYATSTPADEYSVGQWIFNVLYNGLVVPLPLLIGFGMAVVARRHGNVHEARTAMLLNLGLTAAWWLIMVLSAAQDYMQ